MIARLVRLVCSLTCGFALIVVLGGCSSTPPASSTTTSAAALPTQAELLTASATATKAVTSAHFTLTVGGKLPDLQVQGAEGELTSAGDAEGNAKITEFGQLVKVDFVIVRKVLYLKGPTGGFTKIAAAFAGQIYDPTAILSADKGVAAVPTERAPSPSTRRRRD